MLPAKVTHSIVQAGPSRQSVQAPLLPRRESLAQPHFPITDRPILFPYLTPRKPLSKFVHPHGLMPEITNDRFGATPELVPKVPQESRPNRRRSGKRFKPSGPHFTAKSSCLVQDGYPLGCPPRYPLGCPPGYPPGYTSLRSTKLSGTGRGL
jgi:hypothetical protein